MSESHRDFVIESRENLTIFEQSLLALEKACDPEQIRDDVDRSLRAIHSLKGDAGFLGFGTLRALAHAMESVLESYRGALATPPDPVVETLLAARDRLAALVEDLDHSQAADVSDLLTRLSALEDSTFAEPARDLDLDLNAISRAQGGRLGGFFQNLAGLGRLVNPRVIVEGNLSQSLLHNRVRLVARLFPTVPTELVDRIIGAGATRDERPTAPAEIPPARQSAETPNTRDEVAVAAASKVPERGALAESERLSSLRVNVELLDRMMTLVGELTLVRNQSLLAFAEEEGTPQAIIQRLNSVTSELQDTVLRTRMQPVGNLFDKFPRMVRDLARQLGKQVEIVTVGREVELDKTVLEQLSDPLTHLIRNSIDHGIEPPEERAARGKPPTGVVTLSATPADGQVLIEIRDNGRGIDPAAIRTKAALQRLKTQAELDRMSPRELFSLILLPGFSTARQLTEVSGRGVGMDVVKTNVEQLEGSLTIDSVPGEGTSMLLRVPLTLAIIPCLLVEVGEERFAVPQRELEEIVCLHPGSKGAIEQAFDTEVYRLRDRLLPIVRFHEVLQRRQPFDMAAKAEILRRHAPADRDRGKIEYILVLRSRGRRFGLLVDQVRGTQEIVVKPMHPTMKRLGVFSGATLMGDGRVALIADVDGIAEHANCFALDAQAATATATATRDPRELHRVLIFQSGPLEQFAVPLMQIRRLELIDTERIERVGDAEFVTLDGVATRVVRLDTVLNVSACPPQATIYLILPKFVTEPMGILISRIVDTDSLAIDLQETSIADSGILGTAIVRGRLSLFLDVQHVRQQVFGRREAPDARQDHPLSPSASGRRVLLIDDTTFFRETVRRYLEAEGIEVTTAVDGQDGLVKLAAGDFHLIVCDIEMPNLDGLAFAQSARERGCRIPLLALTSLSKSEHEAQALASGFDEYQEKLDHDQLLQAVKMLLARSRQPALAGDPS